MGWFGSSAYEKYLAEQNRNLECENKKLKAYNKSLEARFNPCESSRIMSKFYETKREEQLSLELIDTRIKLSDAEREIKRLKDMYIPAELKAKDKEIETLKALLRFSEEDETEWKDHKELFNFMTRKRHYVEEEMLKREAIEKELQMYKEFFSGNEVKVFLKDKEVKMDEASLNKAVRVD